MIVYLHARNPMGAGSHFLASSGITADEKKVTVGVFERRFVVVDAGSRRVFHDKRHKNRGLAADFRRCGVQRIATAIGR